MTPLVVLCEGQGSVVPGKGKDLYEEVEAFHDAFDEVQKRTDIDLASISWGPDRFRTKADPHLAHVYSFAHQYAQFMILRDREVPVVLATGHSLGELIALTLSGWLSLDEGFRFVDARGRLFAGNRETSNSDMLALIGDESKIREVGEEIAQACDLHLVNFNSPTQIVAALRSDAMGMAIQRFQSAGVRSVPLQLGNGCHSPHVRGIDAPLREIIAGLVFQTPAFPVLPVESCRIVDEEHELRAGLEAHLLSPVHWLRLAHTLLSMGHPMVELGYAKVLRGMLLEIDRKADIRMFESLQARSGFVHA